MKKQVILFFVLIFLSLVFTQSTSAAGNVSLGYECLLDKVEGKCLALTLEEEIFSLLSVGECKSDVVSKSKNNECWPSTNCNLKTTAQALIALEKTTFDTTKGENWLLSKKAIPTDITWYLQTESNEETSCSIEFTGGSFSFSIGEDKKIITSSGQCFTKAQDDYWLKIAGSCHDKTFTISCDKGFSTNLIFQKDGSNVFYISGKLSSAPGGGSSTEEKITSSCFSSGSGCDYGGSLWAAFALTFLGREDDISSFIPYLITSAENNQQFIPDSFLYYITGSDEFKYSLLSKQKTVTGGSSTKGYWQASGSSLGNRVYDTSVALFSLVGEEPQEKTRAKTWLLDVQGANGCWENNIRNTAFVLASTWPEESPVQASCFDKADCDDDEKCVTGICIPEDADCTLDRQCSNDKICVDYYCVECEYDDDCNDGYACNDNNVCEKIKECNDDSDCPNPGDVCSLAGYCISGGDSCINNADCSSGFCVNQTCVECVNETGCSAAYVCQNYRCINLGGDDCVDDADCGQEGYVCDRGSCVSEGLIDCEDAGYYCRGRFSTCEEDGGRILSNYDCPVPQKCCTLPEEDKTCSQLQGEICSSSESCIDGIEKNDASDLSYGETCCTGGTCETTPTTSDCELYGGRCRDSCFSDETQNDDECLDLTQVCCESTEGPIIPEEKNYLWIWILSALILLLLIGILFRNRLRMFFLRFKGGKPKPRPSLFPPPPTTRIMPRPLLRPRRIIPRIPTPARPPVRPQQQIKEKPKGELEEVLKKLKDISK